MIKNKKQYIIIYVILSIISLSVNAQENNYSNNALKYGIGIGMSDSPKYTGGGIVLSIGYQYSCWNNRLHFNPNLNVGYYNAKLITDVRDQFFNSINFEGIINFDLLKYKAISLNIGIGGVVNNKRGLLATGGDPHSSASEYFSNWDYGAYLGIAIKINPKNNRVAFEIAPLNIHIGNEYYAEAYTKIGIIIKLK